MAKLGDAFVEFHADTDQVEPEARRGIRKAAEDIERDDLRDIGKEWGETTSEAMGREFERQGPELARSVEKGLNKRKVKSKVKVEFERDRDSLGRFVSKVTDEIEDAFTSSAGGGKGPFAKIGTAIADAIGAGFNVSGKSPLIAPLVLIVGAIVGLVIAAIQAIGSLVALLITMPALIAAIVGQVVILAVAFNGIGKAVQGAFAAKNAKELNEALKDLTPSAQGFVKQLLQARGYMQQIKFLAQENFFKALGDTFARINTALGARFVSGVSILATSLGNLFRQIGLFFASPTFKNFIDKVIPSIARFLDKFGPSFVHFLEGLFALTTAALPFLERFGDMLGGNLDALGEKFKSIAGDKDFQGWLDRMGDTLESVFELIGQIVQFFAVLMDTIDKHGGQKAIDSLIDGIERFTFLLASPVGQKAIETIIEISILAMDAVFGLLYAIILVAAAIGGAEESVEAFLTAAGDFFVFIGNKIVEFVDWLRTKIREFFGYTDNAMASVGARIGGVFTALRTRVSGTWNAIVAEVRAIPGRITSALGNLANLLYQAGRNLIQGLINGVRASIPSLGNIMSAVAQTVRNYWPFSPARVGPLSGSGDPLLAGQNVMKRFAAGMMMESPTLNTASSEATSNIVFGPNSIRVGFDGVVPTSSQARSTGSAVGAGIQDQLAVRNTRLAVRTL
jgi:hypothetical protein